MRFLASSCWDRPDRGVVAFFLFVHRHPHKRDPRSIRRNLRITDPNKIPEIFFGDVSFLGESDACAKGKQNDEARMTNDERMTKHIVDLMEGRPPCRPHNFIRRSSRERSLAGRLRGLLAAIAADRTIRKRV